MYGTLASPRLAGRAAKPFDVCQEVFLSWTDDTYDSGVAKAYTGITSNSSVPADYAAWAKAHLPHLHSG